MSWFKNLLIRTKLIVSFSAVILFTILLALLAITTVNNLDNSYSYLLDFPQKRSEYLLRIDTSCTAMRLATTAMGLNVDNPEMVSNYWSQFEQSYNEAIDYANQYLENINSDTVRDAATVKSNSDTMTNIKTLLGNYKSNTEAGKEIALATGDFAQVNPVFLQGASSIGEVVSTIKELIPQAAAYTDEVSESNTRLRTLANLEIIIFIIVVIILSVLIALYLALQISKPMRAITGFLHQVGTTGDLKLDAATQKSAQENSDRKDEIGMCSRAAASLLGHLAQLEANLESIADGDLATVVSVLSERDNMGLAMAKTVDNLNSMFGEINVSTAQVAAGSKQLADGSQILSQGSAEQASAIEQLSASITEVSKKTMANAEMAGNAARLAETIMNNAAKGSRQMDEMMSAVKEINQASQNINKVIKAIDDIAFQTNILALNAAVEAARAGQHGKGFAVVAEEVRNLAAKSAEAAKDTGGLIANSIEKAELGARIADETAASLTEIVSGINESSQLVGEIAKSSEEQSAGITQINKGIGQVAQVIQQNSATAEESASASEQMSGQAEMLGNLVAQFRLRDGGAGRQSSLHSAGGAPHKKLSLPGKESNAADSAGGFGKY